MHLYSVQLSFYLQNVKRLVISNSRKRQTIHVVFKLAALSPGLHRLTHLQAFLCKDEGFYMPTLMHQPNVSEAMRRASRVLTQWKHLRELKLSGNLLTGRIGQLLGNMDVNFLTAKKWIIDNKHIWLFYHKMILYSVSFNSWKFRSSKIKVKYQ